MSEAPVVRAPGVSLPEATRAEWLESFDGARIRMLRYGGEGRRGAVLIVPGWAEPSEKYAEVALDLIDRGFETFCYDPRGQGLSQRIEKDDPRGRIDDFAKHVRDLEAVVAKIGGDRLALLGHSMGGLTILSYLAQGGRADAAVLSAPATRIFPRLWQRTGVRGAVGMLCLFGLSDLPISKEGGQAMEFEGNTLTSDPVRHAYLRDLLLEEEGLALPRTTPAMAAALHRQQAQLGRKETLAKIAVPTRIVSLPDDVWVDASHHPRVAAGCAMIELTEIAGSRHEVLMEADEYRDAFWDAFDTHVDTYLPEPSSVST